MMRKRLSEERIIGVLNEAEAGATTADLARPHGVSERRRTAIVSQKSSVRQLLPVRKLQVKLDQPKFPNDLSAHIRRAWRATFPLPDGGGGWCPEFVRTWFDGARRFPR